LITGSLFIIFTDDLKEVFDLSLAEDVQLFELLQTAYSAARYKDDFNPDQKLVKELSDKVCLLYMTAEQFYNEVIKRLKD